MTVISGFFISSEDNAFVFVTEDDAFAMVTEDFAEIDDGGGGGFGNASRGRRRDHHNVFIDLGPPKDPKAEPEYNPDAEPPVLEGATPEMLEAAMPEPVPEQVRARGPSAVAVYERELKRAKFAEHNRRVALLLRRRW